MLRPCRPKASSLLLSKSLEDGSAHKVSRAESMTTTDTLVEANDEPTTFANLPDPTQEPNTQADLWQEAIAEAKLKVELPSDMVFDSSNRASTLQKILQEASKRCNDIQISRRTFRKGGKDVTYREVYGKIIRWVEKFQIIGDIAVQADAGYASLPWVPYQSSQRQM